MSLVTQMAPDFTANAVMADNTISPFTLSSLRGKYTVLFFYPMDFTFVCPTELIAFDNALKRFKELNTEVVSVSVDSEFSHFAWKNTERNKGGVGCLHYPMVSDFDKSISRNYGVLINNSIALRGLFLIDRDGVVRHELINDLPLGRNVEEALRMVKSLQFVEKYGEVCPANWKEGREGLKPTANGVAEYIAKHKDDDK
ncbi:MAG: peroxiredoxin [Victivallaceae bacterium]|nr:peroxiredoxin [Victivallaceae bacterium]